MPTRWQVVLADLDVSKAQQSVDQLKTAGYHAAAVRCDVRKRADLDAAVATAVREFGGLDIAVANAGDDP